MMIYPPPPKKPIYSAHLALCLQPLTKTMGFSVLPKTRQTQGAFRGWNHYLTGNVVTNLEELLVHFAASQRADFLNCMFWLSLSEKG